MLSAETIDLISPYNLENEPQKLPIEKFEFRWFKDSNLPIEYANKNIDVKKTVVFNCILESNSPIFNQPKERLIYILMEPWTVDQSYLDKFSRVYSWDDLKVDNIKHFKINYPYLMPMVECLPSFGEKKFCVLIATNMTPERINILTFFENKPWGDLHLYGRRLVISKNYRGSIKGGHSGSNKQDTLKQYKFCICFENTVTFPGYITEKIFNCFAAGCVPVYWGAPNVTDYIPKGCFIDYRDFKSDDDLYSFLKEMKEEEYNQYLDCIRTFLKSDQAQIFTPKAYEDIFLNALMQ